MPRSSLRRSAGYTGVPPRGSHLASGPTPPLSPNLSRPLTLVQLRQSEEILVVSFRAEDVGQQNLPEPKSERMTAEDPGIAGP